MHQIRPNNVLSWSGLYFERKSTGSYVAMDAGFMWEVDAEPSDGMYTAELYLAGAKLARGVGKTRYAALSDTRDQTSRLVDRISSHLVARRNGNQSHREQQNQEVSNTKDTE